MENEFKIAAIAWAAHRAGQAYGDFAVQLSAGELDKVYCDYVRHRREEQLRLLARKEKAAGKTSAPRKRQELPPPPPKQESKRGGRTYSFNTGAAMNLYRQGWDDGRIGKELGMSRSAIRNWRRRQGLVAVQTWAKKPHP